MSISERVSCNGNCPYLEKINLERDNYIRSKNALIFASGEGYLFPDNADRKFERSFENLSRVHEFIEKLPKRCQRCFFKGIEKEDIE